MRRRMRLAWLVMSAILLAGCSASETDMGSSTGVPPSSSAVASTFTVTSSAFADGGNIPRKYTCDQSQSNQTSFPLDVTGAPVATVSLALIMQDPDVPVPEAPTQTLTHWVVWNVSVAGGTATFPEGQVPAGAVQGKRDFGSGYLGPCPPVGSNPHHYNVTLYALDTKVQLPASADRTALEAAMQGHVLATARLMGLYARQPV